MCEQFLRIKCQIKNQNPFWVKLTFWELLLSSGGSVSNAKYFTRYLLLPMIFFSEMQRSFSFFLCVTLIPTYFFLNGKMTKLNFHYYYRSFVRFYIDLNIGYFLFMNFYSSSGGYLLHYLGTFIGTHTQKLHKISHSNAITIATDSTTT